ncbi:VanZ family protein [Clostridium botulinum]|uniref:VanZ family protein n=1 Tax=Clostridium botulinum TaxID=1491 RepID=UPI00035BACD2|nr:VanZ family protein [Clostridium botulinum]AJD26494.1 vanZ like family protein [Clostridium botulinum CDC_297]EPS52200.1 protein VanZ [Clostridium botulinum A1 str. CFSAN002368]APR01886.1 vanZ like family protein [Clostridium botulinum]APU59871.1 vanZ like family protein [Clostridium botulinum]AUN02587.1 protein VanZ [Clostridium botulinum]
MSKLGKILLLVYVFLLIWILLFKFSVSPSAVISRTFDGQSYRHINLIPLMESGGRKEVLLNFIVFIPLGLIAQLVGKKNPVIKNAIYILIFSLFIEVSQYILAVGATDITDLLTNTFGGVVGILLYWGLSRLFDTKKLDKILVIVGLTLLVLAVLIVFYLVFIMGVRIRYF